MICPCVLHWGAANSWSRAIPLFRNSFVESSLAASLGRAVPPNLISSLRFERRHRHRLTVAIDGDEGEITRIGVQSHSRKKIFGLDPYSDFHRSAADVIHARLHDEQVSDVYRLAKVDAIHRHRNTDVTRVADRRDRGRGVHHRQHHTSEDVADHVCVLRHHQLRCFMLALLHSARRLAQVCLPVTLCVGRVLWTADLECFFFVGITSETCWIGSPYVVASLNARASACRVCASTFGLSSQKTWTKLEATRPTFHSRPRRSRNASAFILRVES